MKRITTEQAVAAANRLSADLPQADPNTIATLCKLFTREDLPAWGVVEEGNVVVAYRPGNERDALVAWIKTDAAVTRIDE